MAMSKWRALAAISGMVAGSFGALPASPASAAPVPGAWITAIDLSSGLVTSDTTADGDAVVVSSTPVAGLPTAGSSYLVLSTGHASQTFGPDPATFVSTDLDAGATGVDGNDLTQARLTLAPPSGATCLAFDFFFASEEFPEYVGSAYNDTFTAELNESSWFLDGSQLVAPNNFAYDAEGNALSINTVFGMAPVAGTTMDGATPPLTATTPVELDPDTGRMELILSLQDLGDSIFDSAVGVDNLRWLYGPNCERSTDPLTDTDGDALSDVWETEGIDYDNDGTPELDLPAMGADPQHKDIFVETDWMFLAPTCNGAVCFGGEDFTPLPDALADVRASFAAAPVPNPDGTTGIRMHIDSGPGSLMNPVTGATWGNRSRANAVAHDPVLGAFAGSGAYDWTELDAVKTANLDAFRRDAFHYVLYADQYGSAANTSSGISRGIPGSDLLVTDGGWNNGAGFTRTQERGTFMHELGHGLGLGHGGGDHVNRKPNYLSIMSYAFQLTGTMPAGTLDYSRETLDQLNEAALSEAAGLDPDGAVGGLGTRWSCGADNTAATDVDWNCNGAINGGTVNVNVNGDNTTSTLTGYDDWENVRFDGGSIGDLGDAEPLPTTTEADLLDPALAREINALAKAGDGTVEVVGPTMLLADTGDRNVVFDVTNSSEVGADYVVDVESDLPFTDTSGGPLTVPGEGTGRVRLPVDTDGLAPGSYDVTAILRTTGGTELHRREAVVEVPDLDDPAVADEVAATVDEVAQMDDDDGLDPEIRDEIVAMAAAAGIGSETVELTITPLSNPGAAFVVRGPVTTGSVSVSPGLGGRPNVSSIGTITTPDGPVQLNMSHTPVLLGLSLGHLQVTLPDGTFWPALTPTSPPGNLAPDGATGSFQGWRAGTGNFRITYEVYDRP